MKLWMQHFAFVNYLLNKVKYLLDIRIYLLNNRSYRLNTELYHQIETLRLCKIKAVD